MTVTEKLGALGSWSVKLSEDTPEEVRAQLDYFGHVALIRGRVNPADHGDTLLNAARYVGVLRRRQGDLESELSGSGMVFWLGDEDDKGAVIESKLVLTDVTLAQAVQAIIDLCPAVKVGNVLASPAGTYTGTHQWVTAREALQVVCDAFGVEFRVNGDASVDVGTQAQLYATTPGSIVVRRGAGSDLDLSALTGTFEPDTSVIDYSTRVVLVGQTLEDGTFATGSAELDTVPYVDLLGNPVKFVRLISESEQTEGAVGPRAQLQLNRFARVGRSLKVTAERYETDGTFRVGDNAYVYDPDTGIVSAAQEVTFRGQVLHPDVVRIAGITWPVSEDHTVAFRTQAGEWIDLTRWVVWETGDNELTLGDLPRSLLGGGGNPVLDRQTSSPLDTIAPQKPTGLTLSSYTATAADGHEAGFIVASWTAPVLNEDGSVLTDLSHYLVAWKWSPGLQWQYATVTDTDATLQAVPGLPYDVWVSAYDRSNNWSGWTAPESITVTTDQTPPPAPEDPTVTDYLMQLRIAYAGVDLLGNLMPADTARVDVETAPSSTGPWTVVSSLSPFVPGVAYATAPTDAATFVRLVAYDHTGNASDPSGAVSGTTSKVVGDDILDGAVGTEKLADLAVTNAKIGLLAVNDANVGNLNVGKLLGGILDAGVVIGGSLSTQPLPSGQHVSITSDAIEAWADTTTQTMRLDGVANLLTGTLQTALDGERRIVAGAVGAGGELSFYSPEGDHGFVTGYTEGNGVEAIQFGLEIPTTNFLWNRLNMNTDQWTNLRSNKIDLYIGDTDGFFIIRTTSDKGETNATERLRVDSSGLNVFDSATQGRLSVGETAFTVWDDAGELRFQMDAAGTRIYHGDLTDGTPRERLRIDQNGLFVTDHSGDLRLLVDSNGFTYAQGDGQTRIAVKETAADGFQLIDEAGRFRIWQRANNFTLWGDDNLTDLDFGPDSLNFLPGAGDKRGSIEIRTNPSYGISPRLRFWTNRASSTNAGVWSGVIRNLQGNFEFRDGDDVTWAQVRTGDLIVHGSVFADGQVQSNGVVLTSDASLKDQIRTLDPGALAKVVGTRATSYLLRGQGERRRLGLVAQESPAEIVVTGDDGVLGVDVYGMAALTWAAVQELAAVVAEMRKDAA